MDFTFFIYQVAWCYPIRVCHITRIGAQVVRPEVLEGHFCPSKQNTFLRNETVHGLWDCQLILSLIPSTWHSLRVEHLSCPTHLLTPTELKLASSWCLGLNVIPTRKTFLTSCRMMGHGCECFISTLCCRYIIHVLQKDIFLISWLFSYRADRRWLWVFPYFCHSCTSLFRTDTTLDCPPV